MFRLRPPGRTQFDSAASAVIDAMSVSMPATDARKVVINNFILALKAATIWDFLDVMYVPAAHAPSASLLNWKTPGTFTGVPVNSPSWQADRGYTGNGTNSRVNTTWVPSTNAVNYTLNNAAIWSWSPVNLQSDGYDIGISSDANANRVEINSWTSINRLSVRLNSTLGSFQATTSSQGLSGAQRVNSTTITTWRNGVQGSSGGVVTTALPTLELWLCGVNATSFGIRQIAFGAAGAALTGKELAFYSAILAYMQAVGAA